MIIIYCLLSFSGVPLRTCVPMVCHPCSSVLEGFSLQLPAGLNLKNGLCPSCKVARVTWGWSLRLGGYTMHPVIVTSYIHVRSGEYGFKGSGLIFVICWNQMKDLRLGSKLYTMKTRFNTNLFNLWGVANISSFVCCQKKVYKNQVEQVLQSYVFPEFQSADGYMRARACWVLHYFCDVKFLRWGEGFFHNTAFHLWYEHVVERNKLIILKRKTRKSAFITIIFTKLV